MPIVIYTALLNGGGGGGGGGGGNPTADSTAITADSTSMTV